MGYVSGSWGAKGTLDIVVCHILYLYDPVQLGPQSMPGRITLQIHSRRRTCDHVDHRGYREVFGLSMGSN